MKIHFGTEYMMNHSKINSQSQLEDILQKQHDLQMKLNTVNMDADYLQDELNALRVTQETTLKEKNKLHQSRLKEMKIQEEKIEKENTAIVSEIQKLVNKVSSLKHETVEKKKAVFRVETIKKTTVPAKTLFESNQNEMVILQNNIEEIEMQTKEETAKKKSFQIKLQELEEIVQEKTLILNDMKNALQEKVLEARHVKSIEEEEKLKEVNVDKKGNSLFAEFHDYTEEANKKVERIEEMIVKANEALLAFKTKMRKTENEMYSLFHQEQQLPPPIHRLETLVTKLSGEKEKYIEKLMELERVKELNTQRVVHPKSIINFEEEYEYFFLKLANLRKEAEKSQNALKLERFLTVVIRDQLMETIRRLNCSKSALQDEEEAYQRLQSPIANTTSTDTSLVEETKDSLFCPPVKTGSHDSKENAYLKTQSSGHQQKKMPKMQTIVPVHINDIKISMIQN